MQMVEFQRFDKIKYFYNQILKKDVSEEKIINLSNKFASIIKEKIFLTKIF